ncbi:MAG TPA: RNA polymerase sigma factor [Bacteroidota bacterium]|nr:RNA polymerase sigma factor [Bacteroidota bacterium]
MTDEQQHSESRMPADTELIVQAQRGNMNAFEELVQRYDKRVFTIAAGYVRSADDAKDIYQEVFLRVYKGLSKFELRSEFSTWLYRITTNVCLSHRSNGKRLAHTSLDELSQDEEGQPYALKDSIAGDELTDRHTHNEEISERVQQAMNKLSPKQRMVFTLKHYEGYKLKEIAAMLNCTEGTVKKYLFEATARMRGQLKDLV